MDISSIEYIPRVCDLFGRKVKLENGKEVDVEVWDSAGLNYFQISYSMGNLVGRGRNFFKK